MEKKIIIWTVIFALVGGGLVQASGLNQPDQLIAHAGGSIYGLRLTNSREAVEKSYSRGFKYIEIDFNWTKDQVPVAIHDWGPMVERMFMVDQRVLSHSEFKSFKTLLDLEVLDIFDLVAWLEKTPDSFIVTDVKENNIQFLYYIDRHFPLMKDRFIPQVYNFYEYELARDLGYREVILTLYESDYLDWEVVEFARLNPVFAITIPYEKTSSQLVEDLAGLGVRTYVHTINDLYIYEGLKDRGVYGIYTDYFEAGNFPYKK